ncbi:hypothetical protein [Halorussus halobius]|uniref:hypothetical protein n=1 Tax=Halorussus halobius TaxID=1710537 RepID=UPI00143D1A88|nr:hypothetical protein [Halorussus halobius]
MNSQDISEDDLLYAAYQVKEASDRLKRAKDRVFLADADVDPENISIEDLNKFAM